MGRFDKLYAEMPVALQHLIVSAYGLYWKRLRFGQGFRNYAAGYIARERYDRSEWDIFQRQRLTKLLETCTTQVPYYMSAWTTAQKSQALAGNLQALPLLEKAPIREAPKMFLRRDLRITRPLIFHTSGTTGTPIASYWTVDELRDSMALREVRSARWAGVSFSLPRATFSGRLVEPDPNSRGPFHRFNAAENQVYFSAFHLRPDTAWQYVQALRDHKIQWMTGYAVSFYILAKFVLEQKLEVSPLKAIVTTSEKLTPEMRLVMEQAYGCRAYEEYSTVENAVFASECEYGRLHINPDAGIVEILDPSGNPCNPGEVGEVVATSFIRTYQPFVRYRLGDLAAWDDELCPCGRNMPVVKEVVGRIEDVVLAPDGRRMVRFHGIFVDQPHVQEGQIVQEAIDFLRVRIVPKPGFGEADAQDILSRMQQRLGSQVRVLVEEVEEIPRLPSGKFPAVVSNLRELEYPEAETTGIVQEEIR